MPLTTSLRGTLPPLFLLLLAATAGAPGVLAQTTDPVDSSARAAAVVPAERVRLDVKTKLLEKLSLSPIKNGAVLLIDESDWGTTTELGEDYALWIRNAERVESSDSVRLAFDLELREPATFGDGELLVARRVELVYPRSERWEAYAPEATEELVASVERYAGYGLAAVRIVASPLTALALTSVLHILEGELPGGSLDGAKLEAMIAGTRISYEARSMVEEEKKGRGTEGPKDLGVTGE